jgi:2-(1,2-epoxy-1,2-dihydrophenyl)acetyl-CoA isomerase
LLPRIVGLQRAKELAMFGDILSADEAQAIGLVSRVVPRSELDDTVHRWATRLAEAPALALSLTKALLNHGMGASMEVALESEAAASVTAQSSADALEAKEAFVEKRDGVFTGGSLLPTKGGAQARAGTRSDRPANGR